ncbi:MAG: hypothetical protein P4M15_06630 [Alphaproteobacteria bacterium]|nr:hypothetical protein [Alphaproteobacteria bacterium]
MGERFWLHAAFADPMELFALMASGLEIGKASTPRHNPEFHPLK